MKALPKAAGTAVLVLFAALASSGAMAGPYGHGHGHGGRGYGHGFSHGGNVRFGISLGVPIFGPRYYPAPYYAYPRYPYPAVVVQPSPPVYIERGAAAPAPSQAQGDWYYCAESGAYYPYVAQCPAGWQRVPAQPPAN